ncbi:MAG: hypothetical protein IMZ53_12080 [Thermoplasmata archaeon]|nr:hypothetical protein [Thermoplasmata archaeon]MBE3141302.1 hypothetical protein [Thermoplasmata archaeon]
MVFSFWFVKDGIVESFVCENEIDDAEVLSKTTMKRTIAVCRVLTDDFFESNKSY